jgi:hypothetical protein
MVKWSSSSPVRTEKPDGRCASSASDCARLPELSLTPTMLRRSARRSSVFVGEVHRRAIGDVVDDDRPVGRVGDGREMPVQAVLRRAVVIGADREDAQELEPTEALSCLDHFAGVVAADADQHRLSTGHDLDGGRHDRVRLGLVEGWSLARGAEGNEAGNAVRHVVLDQAPVAHQIDLPVLERSDQRHPDSR